MCSNFNDYFHLNHHKRTTRNSDIMLHLPKVRLEISKSLFFAMGAKLYNLLPKSISESEADFKQKLKDFTIDAHL